MENQVYRIQMEPVGRLELFVCKTNEVNPYKEIRELGVVLMMDGKQLDASLDTGEIESLIDYLAGCKEYISEYNSQSKR